MIEGLHLGIVFFLGKTWFHGVKKSYTLFPDLVLKQNIEAWLA